MSGSSSSRQPILTALELKCGSSRSRTQQATRGLLARSSRSPGKEELSSDMIRSSVDLFSREKAQNREHVTTVLGVPALAGAPMMF